MRGSILPTIMCLIKMHSCIASRFAQVLMRSGIMGDTAFGVTPKPKQCKAHSMHQQLIVQTGYMVYTVVGSELGRLPATVKQNINMLHPHNGVKRKSIGTLLAHDSNPQSLPFQSRCHTTTISLPNDKRPVKKNIHPRCKFSLY